MSFDSLTFARRLKSAGFSETQAEALADANREMLVPALATKTDLAAVEQRLDASIAAVEQRLETSIATVEQRLGASIAAVDQRLTAVEQRLGASIEALGLRLTIRLGAMMAAAVAILGGILRLH